MWYKVQSRFVGTQQVRPSWWKPWSNTLLYMPFKTDLLDHSWNWVSFTNSWGVTIQNGAAYFTGSNYLYSKSFNSISSYQTNCTISVWFKNTSSTNAERTAIHQFYYGSWKYYWYSLWCRSDWKIMVQNTYTGSVDWTQPSYWTTQRWNVVLVRDNPSKIYINWVLYQNGNTNDKSSLYSWIWIWWSMRYNGDMWEYKWIWYISEVIIEWKKWTAQEVLNYYNQTKSTYWL